MHGGTALCQCGRRNASSTLLITTKSAATEIVWSKDIGPRLVAMKQKLTVAQKLLDGDGTANCVPGVIFPLNLRSVGVRMSLSSLCRLTSQMARYVVIFWESSLGRKSIAAVAHGIAREGKSIGRT